MERDKMFICAVNQNTFTNNIYFGKRTKNGTKTSKSKIDIEAKEFIKENPDLLKQMERFGLLNKDRVARLNREVRTKEEKENLKEAKKAFKNVEAILKNINEEFVVSKVSDGGYYDCQAGELHYTSGGDYYDGETTNETMYPTIKFYNGSSFEEDMEAIRKSKSPDMLAKLIKLYRGINKEKLISSLEKELQSETMYTLTGRRKWDGNIQLPDPMEEITVKEFVEDSCFRHIKFAIADMIK